MTLTLEQAQAQYDSATGTDLVFALFDLNEAKAKAKSALRDAEYKSRGMDKVTPKSMLDPDKWLGYTAICEGGNVTVTVNQDNYKKYDMLFCDSSGNELEFFECVGKGYVLKLLKNEAFLYC